MNQQIKKYFISAYLAHKEERVFTLEFLMSLFLIIFQTVIYWLVFNNILTLGSALSPRELLQYYVIMNLVTLSILPAQYVAYEHQEAINSGAIILDIMRPLCPIWSRFFNKLMSFAVRLCVYLLFILLAQVIIPSAFQISSLLWGSWSCFCGFVILYLLQALLCALSVWLRDVSRIRDVLIYDMALILGGQLFPSGHLVSWLKHAVYYTPFPYIYDVPTTIFQGHFSPNRLLGQIFWIVLLGALYLSTMKTRVLSQIDYGA